MRSGSPPIRPVGTYFAPCEINHLSGQVSALPAHISKRSFHGCRGYNDFSWQDGTGYRRRPRAGRRHLPGIERSRHHRWWRPISRSNWPGRSLRRSRARGRPGDGHQGGYQRPGGRWKRRFARSMRVSAAWSILVNNAAIDITVPIEELAIEDWRRIVDINLSAPFTAVARGAAAHAPAKIRPHH